jgi:hypothetical protein
MSYGDMPKNSSGNIPYQLDPDRLALTKKDVCGFIDRVIERLKQNQLENWQLIVEMEVFKGYIKIRSEKAIQSVWREIVLWFNDLLMENTVKQMEEEGFDYQRIWHELKKKALKK